jgi:hypothetical protein
MSAEHWQAHAQKFEDQYFELLSNPVALRRALGKLRDTDTTPSMILRAIDLENNRLGACDHEGSTQNIVTNLVTRMSCPKCGTYYDARLIIPNKETV